MKAKAIFQRARGYKSPPNGSWLLVFKEYSDRTLTRNYIPRYHLLYNNLTLTKFPFLVAEVLICMHLYLGVHLTVDVVFYICGAMSISRYEFDLHRTAEVKFSSLSVCLSLCVFVCLFVWDITKTHERIFTKLSGYGWHRTKKHCVVDCFTHT